MNIEDVLFYLTFVPYLGLAYVLNHLFWKKRNADFEKAKELFFARDSVLKFRRMWRTVKDDRVRSHADEWFDDVLRKRGIRHDQSPFINCRCVVAGGKALTAGENDGIVRDEEGRAVGISKALDQSFEIGTVISVDESKSPLQFQQATIETIAAATEVPAARLMPGTKISETEFAKYIEERNRRITEAMYEMLATGGRRDGDDDELDRETSLD